MCKIGIFEQEEQIVGMKMAAGAVVVVVEVAVAKLSLAGSGGEAFGRKRGKEKSLDQRKRRG